MKDVSHLMRRLVMLVSPRHMAIAVVLTMGMLISGCTAGDKALGVYDSITSAVGSAVSAVNNAGITQKEAYVARNGFVVAQRTATRYLTACQRHLDMSVCSKDNRTVVAESVRSGRIARNELKSYMASCPLDGLCARSAYDKLVSLTNTINGVAVEIKN